MVPGSLQGRPAAGTKRAELIAEQSTAPKVGVWGGGGLCNAAIIWGGLQCISYGLGEASSALGGTVGPHGSTVSSSCTRMGIPALPWSERGQSRPQPQRSDGSEDDLQGPFCPNHSMVDL